MGRVPPQPLAHTIICGASRKGKNEEPSAGTPKKPRRMPRSCTRPVIEMVLHQGNIRHRIRALLDTGCSIALINERTVGLLGLERKKHLHARSIENFTGETVKAAGQYYTKPMLLQHRRHYSMEKFEVSPMNPGIDIFLPFEWVTAHPPQGAWTNNEIRFNSAQYLENCTKHEVGQFSLTWDETVATDPVARCIGYVSAASDEDPIRAVPKEFRQYLRIMGNEAADALPKHRPYDCKIDLQKGSMAPWGPIYPLSEVEHQTLREWLKEME